MSSVGNSHSAKRKKYQNVYSENSLQEICYKKCNNSRENIGKPDKISASGRKLSDLIGIMVKKEIAATKDLQNFNHTKL
ncbi:MAG: hypothetical protein ACYCSO_04025 [Cuniculiplasma sp.]